MRYFINFDKTVNQLVPHYLGGRKLILFLQSLVKPLQQLNNEFVSYAKETRIDALMTSQVAKFEWYLNHKLKKYFNRDGYITIQSERQPGIPIYIEGSQEQGNNLILYKESENIDNVALRYIDEKTTINAASFIVKSPAINTAIITLDEYKALLTNYIEKYRLAGKSYLIIITK